MKKRRFYYTSWAYFIGILVLNSVFVPLCTSTAAASASDSQNQDSIFVFPSMQMDSLPAKSDHVPMVEVIYRGQPPPADHTDNALTSTTSTSREVITTESPIMTKGTYMLTYLSINKDPIITSFKAVISAKI